MVGDETNDLPVSGSTLNHEASERFFITINSGGCHFLKWSLLANPLSQFYQAKNVAPYQLYLPHLVSLLTMPDALGLTLTRTDTKDARLRTAFW